MFEDIGKPVAGAGAAHARPRLPRERRRDEAIAVVAVRRHELHALVALVLRGGERLPGHRRAVLGDEARAEVVHLEGEVHARALRLVSSQVLAEGWGWCGKVVVRGGGGGLCVSLESFRTQ